MRKSEVFQKPRVLQQNELSVSSLSTYYVQSYYKEDVNAQNLSSSHAKRKHSVCVWWYVCVYLCMFGRDEWLELLVSRPLTKSVVQHKVLHCHIPSITLDIWHVSSSLWIIPSSLRPSYFFCEYIIWRISVIFTLKASLFLCFVPCVIGWEDNKMYSTWCLP